jgi:hypothetical protein
VHKNIGPQHERIQQAAAQVADELSSIAALSLLQKERPGKHKEGVHVE